MKKVFAFLIAITILLTIGAAHCKKRNIGTIHKNKPKESDIILSNLNDSLIEKFLNLWYKVRRSKFKVIPILHGRYTVILSRHGIIIGSRPEFLNLLEKLKKFEFVKDFRYIGYVGWCRECNAGLVIAKVDYYFRNVTVNGKTYTFILAIFQGMAIGHEYSPEIMITTTDWKDRGLYDWGPKIEGYSNRISYTLSNSSIVVNYTNDKPVLWLDLTKDNTAKTVYVTSNVKKLYLHPYADLTARFR